MMWAPLGVLGVKPPLCGRANASGPNPTVHPAGVGGGTAVSISPAPLHAAPRVAEALA